MYAHPVMFEQMYMLIFTCIYIYIYTYLYVYMCIHILICVHMFIYIHICVYIRLENGRNVTSFRGMASVASLAAT